MPKKPTPKPVKKTAPAKKATAKKFADKTQKKKAELINKGPWNIPGWKNGRGTE